MKSWFLNRGNPKIIDAEVSKVKFLKTYGDKSTKTN